MSAAAAPYRIAGESPLFAIERRLETELAATRELMCAYANDELRLARLGLVGKATHEELRAVREALAAVVSAEARLVHELQTVRSEIIMRGERKAIGAARRVEPEDIPLMPAILFALMTFGFLLASVIYGDLRNRDTAEREPASASLPWGGPLEPGKTWLYVEGPAGDRFQVDGRFFVAPNRVSISALHSHDIRFEHGGGIVVRWIPCTTAVVSYDADGQQASVERFYNSATCF